MSAQAETLRGEYATELDAGDTEQANQLWDQASDLLLQSVDWKGVWWIPAMFALGVLVFFVVSFWEKKSVADKAAN